MDIVKDIAAKRDLIESAIKKYGYAPEHNFFHFMNWQAEGTKNYFFAFKEGAILARKEDEVWYIFSEIMAPPAPPCRPPCREAGEAGEAGNRLKILGEFLDFCFSDSAAEKVSVEFETDFRQEVLKFLKNTPYRACPINYSLTWPIFDLKKWDPELKGGEWKKLRYQTNLFYRQRQVQIVDSRECQKTSLKKIVEAWRQTREGRDRAYSYPYLNLIDADFKGVKFCRSFIVDGVPATITVGWEIPNQPGGYYSAVGLHNYLCDYLGEAANLDDLNFLKQQGYHYANFGGGEKDLTDFKMKFRPQRTYKTHIFSIKRR